MKGGAETKGISGDTHDRMYHIQKHVVMHANEKIRRSKRKTNKWLDNSMNTNVEEWCENKWKKKRKTKKKKKTKKESIEIEKACKKNTIEKRMKDYVSRFLKK